MGLKDALHWYLIPTFRSDWDADDADHKCKVCLKNFTTKSKLQQHSRNCVNLRPSQQVDHQCPKCNLSFSTLNKLFSHEVIHSKVRILKCGATGCSFSASVPQSLVLHRREKHINNYTCYYCEKSFKILIEFKQHIDQHKTDTPSIFKCLHIGCQKLFAVPMELKTHTKTQHMELQKCNIASCNFKSTSLCDLQLHQKNAHTNLRHKCEGCGRSFKRPRDLNYHIRINKTCSVVNSQEEFSSNLEKHTDSRDENSTQIEERSPDNPARHKLHLRSDVINSEKQLLQKQKLGHKTPDVLKCTFKNCKKTFNSASKLKKHAAKHRDFSKSKERQFSCDFPGCNVSFKTKRIVSHHMRKIHSMGAWLCKMCGKQFKHKLYLTQHVKRAHEKQQNGDVSESRIKITEGQYVLVCKEEEIEEVVLD